MSVRQNSNFQHKWIKKCNHFQAELFRSNLPAINTRELANFLYRAKKQSNSKKAEEQVFPFQGHLIIIVKKSFFPKNLFFSSFVFACLFVFFLLWRNGDLVIFLNSFSNLTHEQEKQFCPPYFWKQIWGSSNSFSRCSQQAKKLSFNWIVCN